MCDLFTVKMYLFCCWLIQVIAETADTTDEYSIDSLRKVADDFVKDLPQKQEIQTALEHFIGAKSLNDSEIALVSEFYRCVGDITSMFLFCLSE